MIHNQYNVIGVMSGTSLDGVDLAYITFNYKENHWTFDIIVAETIPYSNQWVTSLKEAIHSNREEIEEIDKEYTIFLGEIINHFIQKNNIHHLDLVCSHGHTILHRPDLGYTYQIGNRSILADIINTKVVCDFRVQDVLLGGQGAPLVPIGDRLLFENYNACLNLGGFANVSYENNLGFRIAYDICPVNVLLNAQANKLELKYDNGGELARSGKVNESLLTALNNIEFYKQLPPKSLGIEFVMSELNPAISSYSLSVEDYLATLTEHIAMQIAAGIKIRDQATILVTGGGAFNTYLLERMSFYATNYKFEVPNALIVNFKEAIVFALLGVLKIRDEVNVLSSVTGAQYDHSSGVIHETFDPVY